MLRRIVSRTTDARSVGSYYNYYRDTRRKRPERKGKKKKPFGFLLFIYFSSAETRLGRARCEYNNVEIKKKKKNVIQCRNITTVTTATCFGETLRPTSVARSSTTVSESISAERGLSVVLCVFFFFFLRRLASLSLSLFLSHSFSFCLSFRPPPLCRDSPSITLCKLYCYTSIILHEYR